MQLLFATSSFVEDRSLVPSFANVIRVLSLLQASEFYHVRLMKASPKLPFIVVIVIFFILFSSMSSSTSEANSSIFLDIQELHEVPVPTNQEPSQSEIPTSGYGQNIEGVHSENFWTIEGCAL